MTGGDPVPGPLDAVRELFEKALKEICPRCGAEMILFLFSREYNCPRCDYCIPLKEEAAC